MSTIKSREEKKTTPLEDLFLILKAVRQTQVSDKILIAIIRTLAVLICTDINALSYLSSLHIEFLAAQIRNTS